ncbi:MAG: thiamine pyrophosphokinae [Clostridiales bacterium]|jgi:thiamine pyrophosphokinase|nr:thiamine pyrophosphokinae [Clostridiales bacterium]MDK2932923.1 thiamine pyrophosphokinae [Clostridiales bacterium]
MRGWIISNGSMGNYSFYKNKITQSDLIICADGGAIHAEKMGIIPHVIIGDLDSIENNCNNRMLSKEVKFIKYLTDKDETDTQLAVEYAIQNGCSEIILIGCLGSRFDHSFANVSLLKFILDRKRKGMILNENNEIYLIDNCIQLKGKIGEKVSLLPITKEVNGITTDGLQYALQNAQMIFGIPNGVSNVFVQPNVKISIRKGLLLVIKAHD